MSISALSAQELLEAYRQKTLTPTQVLEGLLERIQKKDSELNAVTELVPAAHEMAEQATQYWAHASEAPADKPLLGVPVLIKEMHPIEGMILDKGVPALGAVAEKDHPIVERLRAAGAILIARTTTPEFCSATFTDSVAYGPTRNPWDLTSSPGGSSGGSSAAVAAGYAPLATSSDIGGSTRIPATLCGLVGYKAPYGVVPGLHPATMDWYRSDNALGRTVSDVLTMHEIIAGQHPTDPYSLPKRDINVDAESASVEGMRIGISATLGDYAVDPEIQENLRTVAAALEELGATIIEVDPQFVSDRLMEAAMAHYGHTLSPGMKEAIEAADAEVSPYIDQFIEHTMTIAKDWPVHKMFAAESAIREELTRIFSEVDVLLCPVATKLKYPAEAHENSLDEKGRHYWRDYLAVPFNIANRHPSLAVPTGASSDGHPTGLQIVGKPYDEEAVFHVGFSIEKSSPWTHPHLNS